MIKKILIFLGLLIFILTNFTFVEAGRRSNIISSSGVSNTWKYRRAITINNTGSASTDYQVLVTLDTQSLILAGKMKANGDDIRFTDSDGTTQLSYWIESGINATSTKTWVKISSIPSGSKTVYMYYGNPSATGVSSGTNTFLAFDASTFINIGTGITVNSDKTVSWVNPGANSYLYKQISSIGDFVMQWGIQANPWSHLAVGITSYLGIINPATSETISFRYSTPGGIASLLLNTYNGQYQQIVDNPTSVWYYMRLSRIGTTATLAIYSDSNFQNLINSKSLTVSTTSLSYVYYYSTTSAGTLTTSGMVDNKLYLRKSASFEPTTNVGAEESL